MKPAYSDQLLNLRDAVDAYIASAQEADLETLETKMACILDSMAGKAVLLVTNRGNWSWSSEPQLPVKESVNGDD